VVVCETDRSSKGWPWELTGATNTTSVFVGMGTVVEVDVVVLGGAELVEQAVQMRASPAPNTSGTGARRRRK
jgi:hypothetical protein